MEMAGTVGEQRDIVVTINHGLDEYDISLIQAIEKAIDDSVGSLGYSRSTTTKDSMHCELVYYQFGKVTASESNG
jgi:hypothetical protein